MTIKIMPRHKVVLDLLGQEGVTVHLYSHKFPKARGPFALSEGGMLCATITSKTLAELLQAGMITIDGNGTYHEAV